MPAERDDLSPFHQRSTIMTTRKFNASSRPFSNLSRRDFLKTAAFLAGGIGFMGLHGLRPQPASAALDPRASVAGRFALELDGLFIDFLQETDGGFPKAEVIAEPIGPSPFVKKHIGPPKYQDITIRCNPVMPKPLFDWVAATLAQNYIRKNGAIVTGTFDYKEQSRLQFNNALISEVSFPACDGASKEAAYMTVKFSPEFTKPLKGSGAVMKGATAKAQQKFWSAANFRLTIPGVDCSKVSKIDAFTIKQSVKQDNIGELRDYQKTPSKLEFPNLAISIAESNAGTFYAWFEDMVIKGNAGEDRERDGTLEFLSPNRLDVLLTVNFKHLGIFGFAPEKSEANADGIRRVKVEMYCEQITLLPGKA
jgi:hypothetical protein